MFLAVFLAVQFAGRYLPWRGALGTRCRRWSDGVLFALLFYAVLFFSVPVGQKFVYQQF